MVTRRAPVPHSYLWSASAILWHRCGMKAILDRLWPGGHCSLSRFTVTVIVTLHCHLSLSLSLFALTLHVAGATGLAFEQLAPSATFNFSAFEDSIQSDYVLFAAGNGAAFYTLRPLLGSASCASMLCGFSLCLVVSPSPCLSRWLTFVSLSNLDQLIPALFLCIDC